MLKVSLAEEWPVGEECELWQRRSGGQKCVMAAEEWRPEECGGYVFLLKGLGFVGWMVGIYIPLIYKDDYCIFWKL